MLFPNPQKFDHLRCFFVHCPKCAGTSIEQTLKAQGQTVGGHSTAQAMRNRWPQEWGNYFKFAILRDPVERFLSAWRYLRQQNIHPNLGNAQIHTLRTLECFLDALEADPVIIERIVHLMPQSAFVCDANGSVMVSTFVYEDLPESWRRICLILGISKPLPLLNVSTHDTERTERAEEMVRRLYAKDYELCGLK